MSPANFVLQRATALIMAPLVIAHLILIIAAVQGGLTGEEILVRTRGSLGWGVFYGLFVLAAAVHAGIGLQTILREWTNLAKQPVTIASHGFMVLLIVLGGRAVYAVIA